MAGPAQPNLLRESGLPLAYPVDDPADVPTVPALDGHDISARTLVRSLTVMQKEAIVVSSGSRQPWRLSSDEGPYLAGHDYAPPPLAVMSAGLTADQMERIRRALTSSGIDTKGLTIRFDTHFTMEGSMLKQTMVAGALRPEVEVGLEGVDSSAAMGPILTGIAASATSGLIAPVIVGRFSLTSHGREIEVGSVAAAAGPAPPDPGGFEESPPPGVRTLEQPLVRKVRDVADKPADAGVALQETQKRSLHLSAVGRWRPDGVKAIDVDVIRPSGSTFRFLSDELEEDGGGGRAPDAVTLISAGLGFCFMTQIGRFAKIAKHSLGDYRILQDTRFSIGDPSLEPPRPSRAAAPVTHVYMSPDGDDDFARLALDMSEQTCFLHAVCRTELRPRVRITRPAPVPVPG